MELTFVNQYDGSAPKRRRLAKACESCRARKKRCPHVPGAEKGEAEAADFSSDIDGHDQNSFTEQKSAKEPTTGIVHTNGTLTDKPVSSRGTQPAQTPPPSAGGTKRFFSDLTPETTFLHRPASPDQSTERPENEDIGVWVDKREWEALIRQKKKANGPQRQVYAGPRNDQRPHSSVLGPLIEIYFEKVHPLLPLLDEDEFRKAHADGTAPEPLTHAMCLVAAKNKIGWSHCRLGQSPATIPVREFCSRLHASVTGALRAPCFYDKITLIQILALASLHTEGIDGSEEASMWLTQAMHHAQSLGIHLGQQQSSLGGHDLFTKRLFWCLWALDQANSAINGRPIIMSDRDIAIAPFANGESGFPAFDGWLRITGLLNKIIDFYRPHHSTKRTGWEDEYPGFEEIIDDVDGWDLPQSVLMTLHFYYLTVAILSHRTRGVKQVPRGTHSAIRQRLCAGEVIRLMESVERRHLHTLPIIPYGVSLCLSVSYSHLRQSQMQHQQDDARRDFRSCTQVLQQLRRIWSSADVMGTLAQKVLDELDRTQDLSRYRIPRKPKKSESSGDAGSVVSRGVLPAMEEHQDATSQSYLSTLGPNNHLNLHPASAIPPPVQQPPSSDGAALFDGMDDVFGTYLDPNYPVDLSFVDDLPSFDWNEVHQRPDGMSEHAPADDHMV